jgi:hypothetical protein
MQEKIMFDIDDTLYINDAVDIAANKFKTDLNEFSANYNISSCGYSLEMVTAIFKLFNDPLFMGNLKLMPYAKEIVNLLRINNYIIECVTARPKEIMGSTIEMINSDFNNIITKTYFLGSNSKVETLIERGYTVIVEDRAETLLELASDKRVKAKLFLVSTEKSRYNHKFIDDCIANGIIIIKSLKELKEHLNLI